jgi:hypothetical protein
LSHVRTATGRGLLTTSVIAAVAAASFYMREDPLHWWPWVVALLPAAMIVQQAISARLRAATQLPGESARARLEKRELKRIPQVTIDELVEQSRAIGQRGLILRFAVPAFLVAAVCLTGVRVLFAENGVVAYCAFSKTADCAAAGSACGTAPVSTGAMILVTQPADAPGLALVNSGSVVVRGPGIGTAANNAWLWRYVFAARAGFAGAYIFVLLYLGARTFRADVTPGAATWSAVTLAVGPVLAAAIVPLWEPRLAAPSTENWNTALIYFLAGLSPKLVLTYIEDSARRLWRMEPGEGRPNVAPLTSIPGVTQDIADRLGEVGITDANQLAMAHPIRLIRNTPFDARQIADWIDVALLVRYVPDAGVRAALNSGGITGAIDLAEYQLLATPGVPADVAVLVAMLKTNGFDDARLRDLVRRIYYDAQVQFVWALYQSGGGTLPEDSVE